MDDELIRYFIQKTDERLDKIDEKLDLVLRFKWQILGGTAVVGFLVGNLILVLTQ